MSETPTTCQCDWDPDHHRDLNIRRGKPDQGATCTNPVYRDAFGGDSGICVSCLFGCPPEEPDLTPEMQCDHERRCCREHSTHSMPHIGCILR